MERALLRPPASRVVWLGENCNGERVGHNGTRRVGTNGRPGSYRNDDSATLDA
jgi:hypothetical protein